MEDILNVSFNKLFETSNKNYISTKDNLKECFNSLSAMAENDNVFMDVFLYFFPKSSGTEKNDSNFWFSKYKGQGAYNEYLFAGDLLEISIQYNKDKNKELFIEKAITCSEKFGDYNLFRTYFSVIKNYVDNLMLIVAYLTKDSLYYEEAFNIQVHPCNIQTMAFIQVLKKEIENKQEKSQMKNQIKELKNLIMNISIEKAQEKQVWTKLFKENATRMENLENRTKELEEKIDQIYLRDTIKMCFRYLYKVLCSKFKPSDYKNNFWEQLDYIKAILSKEEFSKYDYILDFIEDIQFTKLTPLNTVAHDFSQKNRKIDDIKKYLQSYSNKDLDKVVNFFKDLPEIDEFININLINYFNHKRADIEFEKKKKFLDVYKKIFEENKEEEKSE